MKRAWLIGLLLLGLTRAARADDGAEAKKHYQEGTRHYDLGEFEDAIKEYKEGYKFKDDAVFLYNIAQAYRLEKNFEQALFFYKSYLRKLPTAPNRTEVEARISEMEDLAARQKAAGDAPPQGTKPPGSDSTTGAGGTTTPPGGGDNGNGGTTTPPGGDTGGGDTGNAGGTTTPPGGEAVGGGGGSGGGGGGLRIAGWVTAGAGAVSLGIGIALGLSAKSAASDISSAAKAGGPWSDSLQSKYDSGSSNSTTGAILMGVGAAALVGGGVMLWLGYSKKGHAEAHAQRASGRHFAVTPAIGPGLYGGEMRLEF